MASIARIGILRLGYNNPFKQLCKVTAASNVMQLALISGKAKGIYRQARLPPFDYLNKNYGLWAQLFDPMVDRCDENSKIIVVEGPIAAGKTKVAKKLAEEFDMIYLPPPSFDECYITEQGYDLRSLNDRLSVGTQMCDTQTFLTNPYHPNIPILQFHYLQMKFDQYITTLLHLFSTGQGVVLNRSFYTDYIFAKAMRNAGYIRPKAFKFYIDILNVAKPLMLRPHLIIYLDVPVDAVKENIKKRGISYEVNSKVLTNEYLKDIERIYKQDYLKDIKKHSHVLVYDWTNEGDISVMINDIELLNFDNYKKTDKKLSDWRFENVQDLRTKRWYCQDRYILHADYMRDEYDSPELSYTAEECEEIENAMKMVPGFKFAKDYETFSNKVLLSYKMQRIECIRKVPKDIEVIKEEFKKLQANARR